MTIWHKALSRKFKKMGKTIKKSQTGWTSGVKMGAVNTANKPANQPKGWLKAQQRGKHYVNKGADHLVDEMVEKGIITEKQRRDIASGAGHLSDWINIGAEYTDSMQDTVSDSFNQVMPQEFKDAVNEASTFYGDHGGDILTDTFKHYGLEQIEQATGIDISGGISVGVIAKLGGKNINAILAAGKMISGASDVIAGRRKVAPFLFSQGLSRIASKDPEIRSLMIAAGLGYGAVDSSGLIRYNWGHDKSQPLYLERSSGDMWGLGTKGQEQLMFGGGSESAPDSDYAAKENEDWEFRPPKDNWEYHDISYDMEGQSIDPTRLKAYYDHWDQMTEKQRKKIKHLNKNYWKQQGKPSVRPEVEEEGEEEEEEYEAPTGQGGGHSAMFG